MSGNMRVCMIAHLHWRLLTLLSTPYYTTLCTQIVANTNNFLQDELQLNILAEEEHSPDSPGA